MTNAARRPQPPAAAPAVVSRNKKLRVGCWSLAIVALLFFLFGAIATPKFVAFQCRAKQATAKGYLKDLYVAEQAFRERNGFFTTDLVALNIPLRLTKASNGDGPRYMVGFLRPSTDPTSAAGTDPSRLRTPAPYVPHLKSLPDHEELTRIVGDATADAATFRAFAIGYPSDDDPDVWVIDEQKKLQHPLDGCP
jgi:hypothetical protein